MITGSARDEDHWGGILEWVCGCCNLNSDWRWVIDSNIRPWSKGLSLNPRSKRSIFNIKFQLIIATNFPNLSPSSSTAEMFSKPESEENVIKESGMAKKLAKGEWNQWDRRLKIEISEFDEVMKEIETGVAANFDTEDMEEDIRVEASIDQDGSVIRPERLEMMPKKKYGGPTGLAKWTSLYRRNEDRRTRHVI